MDNIFEKIRKTGIVPVVVIEDAAAASALSDALCEGGLPAAEVTFRTAAAAEAISIIKQRHPGMLIGAGTVLNGVQADRAVQAGAEFIVSPGINPGTVRHCQQIGITVIPGTQTPSDMELAVEMGLDTVKFFPAELSGGLAMIKACAEPFTGLSFMPSGGINASNAGDYLAYGRIIAVGGSWMVKKELISAGDFDTIRDLASEAAQLVRKIRG